MRPCAPATGVHGFTGHTHADDVALIHMGGRVYDPNLGRFLSADPIVQNLTDSQSINPYSYVLNNPFSGVDPTGYATCSVQDYASCLENGSNKIYDDAGRYLGKVIVGANTLSFAGTQAGWDYIRNNGANQQSAQGEKATTAKPLR